MIEELYIKTSPSYVSQLADIETVDIVRNYTSPFFSDVTQLYNDGTQTVRLPLTVTNAAIFEHCYREDFVSDIPYEIQRADYYYDGLLIFKDAEVKILSVEPDYIEVQFVYGVDRTTISPLFDKKLNEIVTNGSTITEDDWIVNWNDGDGSTTGMWVSGKKYKYIDSISGERTTDTISIGGVVQPKIEPEEPAKSNQKQMTMHPFIECGNIIDLITTDADVDSNMFDDIKDRLTDKGLILTGLENGKEQTTQGYLSTSIIRTGIPSDEYLDLAYFISSYPIVDTKIDEVEPTKKLIYIEKDLVSGGTILINITATAVFYDTATKYVMNLYTYFDDSVVSVIPVTRTLTTFSLDDYELNVENINKLRLYIGSTVSPAPNIDLTVSEFDIDYSFKKPFFGYTPSRGYYDCLANLPKITCIDFVKQMLIHIGLFVGYSTAGALKTFSLDTFATNVAAGTCYDWSGRISNVRKGQFQFNSNAQKNYIKFANDKDLTADRKETLTVDDLTIESEKDLYNFEFDSPLGAYDEKSEMIMYEQTVKRSGDTGVSFENKYVGDKWNNGFVKNVSGVAKNLKVADPTYYAVYKKLIERPTIKEVDVNLGLYESATIDFEKPIYISEFGRYCLLLELQAPNNDVCVAKLLIVNQKLT